MAPSSISFVDVLVMSVVVASVGSLWLDRRPAPLSYEWAMVAAQLVFFATWRLLQLKAVRVALRHVLLGIMVISLLIKMKTLEADDGAAKYTTQDRLAIAVATSLDPFLLIPSLVVDYNQPDWRTARTFHDTVVPSALVVSRAVNLDVILAGLRHVWLVIMPVVILLVCMRGD